MQKNFTWFPVFTSFCKNLIDFFHDYRYTTCIIEALCDEVEILLKKHEDHTRKDIEFHTAIALSSKNVVVPRLIPVINSSIPLFVETTGGTLHEETIETHREITDAIASHDPLRAQDAMYLHLVYNRKRMQLSKTPRGILPVNSNFYSIKEKKYGAQIWISM